MKSIKKIALLAFTLLLTTTVMAQQSNSKEINKIKRSSSYLYAEATMESEKDAYEVANELLLQQINEYIASKRKLNKASNVLIKDLQAKSESLTMMRGEMHRVFVYVKKSDIEGVENYVNVSHNDTPADVVPTMPGAPVVVEEPAAEAASAEVEVPADEVAQDVVDSQAASTETNANPMPTPVPAAKVQNSLPTWQQDAVKQLLDCPDITAFRAKLNRMKAEYKVKRFGTPDKCPSVANSFWAIFDTDGRLVTVLGTGENIRIDYRVMQNSSLDVYKGRTALWFTFAK